MKARKSRRIWVLLLAIITLAAIIIPAQAAVSDVKPGSWAYEAIQYNVENKLIAIDYNTYNMNDPAPRQDVAYAMYKLTNGKDREPSDPGYAQYIPMDMQSSQDKYKYSVQWAVENNVIKGTRTEGERVWFSPNSIINREQMATLLYRLAEHDGLETDNYSTVLLNTYADGWSSSKWAQDAMAWCVMNRLMAGTGNNKLSPKMTLTYGQLAKFMKNYGDLKESQVIPEPTETPAPTPGPTPTPDVTPNPGAISGNYYNQTAHPENADKTDWLETYVFTDLSGPWDNVQPVTELPIGGYMKNGHRYNRYGAPLDISDGSTNPVDGIPTDDEKKAMILINQHRINNGLEPLKWDQAAQVIAETRAIESRNFHTEPDSGEHTHTRPNGDDLHNVIDEWRNIGVLKGNAYEKFTYENAFAHCPEYWENDYGYHEGYGPAQIVKGWIESKGHDAALKTWQKYGAVAASHFETDIRDGSKTYYWYYNPLNIY